MYFPKGYDAGLAIELGELIAEAYKQFTSQDDKLPWQLPADYRLVGELTYRWKAINSIDSGSRLEAYLKKLPLLAGKSEVKIPIGFIARRRTDCYVIFRGTQTVKEWISNLNTKLSQHGISGFGNVHEGFLSSYAEIRVGLMANLEKAALTKRLFIGGHSLGGAFATLAAIDIEKTTGRKVSALYSFGSPRVGDDAFVKAFNGSFGKKSFRIANSSDLVTEMPFPAPIAGFVGGYFSHVDTPIVTTVQRGDLEENHRIETYIQSLKESQAASPPLSSLRRLFRPEKTARRH